MNGLHAIAPALDPEMLRCAAVLYRNHQLRNFRVNGDTMEYRWRADHHWNPIDYQTFGLDSTVVPGDLELARACFEPMP